MNILVIAAHPDDEVLGCGGTIAKLTATDTVYILVLGEGITSRNLSKKQKINDLAQLRKDALCANNILGVKKVFFQNLPDNKFDTVPLLDIIKIIEQQIHDSNPEVIYTHHPGDLNVDHSVTFKATLTATRPIGKNYPKKIYSFEILSSTEWGHHNPTTMFTPNTYVDVTNFIDRKIQAMNCYSSEIRPYPHPRSLDGIKLHAQQRGLEVGLPYAEAFCLIRNVE